MKGFCIVRISWIYLYQVVKLTRTWILIQCIYEYFIWYKFYNENSGWKISIVGILIRDSLLSLWLQCTVYCTMVHEYIENMKLQNFVMKLLIMYFACSIDRVKKFGQIIVSNRVRALSVSIGFRITSWCPYTNFNSTIYVYQ